ncbi:MAG: M42 family peptidase [Clostridia bacterium]|nr:M42 family peptidase [Clostridia bacterium]
MDWQLLKKLCLADGVSSDEGRVREIIISEISGYADSIETDASGNLIVFKKGKVRPEKKVLLSAHMDEVGFIITHINSNGTLGFDEVGGIDRRVIPGKRVHLCKSGLIGVVGIRPVHLTNRGDKEKIPKLLDMSIDIGALNKDDAMKYDLVGDIAAFEGFYEENETSIITKALDDRAGCAVLVDMIRSELPYDMYFTFVVQEEVGLRGAKTAAYTVDPDIAVVVETTTAADIPGVDEEKTVCSLGEGAVISFMDRRTIYDRDLYKAAFEAAQRAGVKAQAKQAVAGGNDAGVISAARGGVRTIAVSLPCRYLHSPHTVAYKNDLIAVEKTVTELVRCLL